MTDIKILCLTFDDGPDPDSTPELINILEKHKVKGLFFCDGRAVQKYPELVELIISKGHVVGNHGFMHFDGWRTSTKTYIEDVSKANGFVNSIYFRPPYGHMKIDQYRKLKGKYKIVLWDTMPYDFDLDFSSEKSLQVLIKKVRPGSIIVMHDTPSSSALKILSRFIDFAIGNDYKFSLPDF